MKNSGQEVSEADVAKMVKNAGLVGDTAHGIMLRAEGIIEGIKAEGMQRVSESEIYRRARTDAERTRIADWARRENTEGYTMGFRDREAIQDFRNKERVRQQAMVDAAHGFAARAV